MKLSQISLGLLFALSLSVHADPFKFAGSDTIAPAITDAITELGLDEDLVYTGGGSGVGSANLIEGVQSIAPMSRLLNDKESADLAAKGVTVKAHKIGLDAVTMWVNAGNNIPLLTLQNLLDIYTCAITTWDDARLPKSNLTGPIAIYRRDDKSGTTDTFSTFTHVKKNSDGTYGFGGCVQPAVADTVDITTHTSTELNAIGYAGNSGKDADGLNRAVAIAVDAAHPAVEPNVNTVRSFAYPMSRYLFIYSVTAGRELAPIEATFLENALDGVFMDRKMKAHDFFALDDDPANRKDD